MRNTLFARLLLIIALLFAQQAGAAHALRHALEDLAPQQEDKQVPHSGACEQCATYMQLGGALNVSAYKFTPLIVSGEVIQHRSTSFRSIHVFAAVARGPPSFLQSFA